MKPRYVIYATWAVLAIECLAHACAHGDLRQAITVAAISGAGLLFYAGVRRVAWGR